MVEIPSQNQIWQNPPKPSQETAKKIKEKGLDFLGFSLPDWAFSMGCSDPPGQKNLSLLLFRWQPSWPPANSRCEQSR
jgi:hypothetical protein